MKVRDLVKRVCQLEAKALTDDVRLTDATVPEPSKEYVDIIYWMLVSKSVFDVSAEKVIIHRWEYLGEAMEEPPILETEVREGYWLYASNPVETESIIYLKWCPHQAWAEKTAEEIKESGLFSHAWVIEMRKGGKDLC